MRIPVIVGGEHCSRGIEEREHWIRRSLCYSRSCQRWSQTAEDHRAGNVACDDKAANYYIFPIRNARPGRDVSETAVLPPGSVRYFGRKLTFEAGEIVSNRCEVVCLPVGKVAGDRHRPRHINVIGVHPALCAVE